MKKLSFLLTYLVICNFFQLSSQGVFMYQDINFGGYYGSHKEGSWNKLGDVNTSFWGGVGGMGCKGTCNDNISSIKVELGWSVTVFEHVNFEGSSKIFTSSCSNLHDLGWGDRISSLIVNYSPSYTSFPEAVTVPSYTPQNYDCYVKFTNRSNRTLYFYALSRINGDYFDSCRDRIPIKTVYTGETASISFKSNTIAWYWFYTDDINCTVNYLKSQGILDYRSNNTTIDIW